MSAICTKCGQPLPEEARRDPPLPPLEHPNVVTIHDLPAGTEPKYEEVTHSWYGRPHTYRRLAPNRALDGERG